MANGDVRSALNALELAVLTTPPESGGVIHVTLPVAEESIQRRVLQMDESYFYDMLSAFCKSLRGSDADAALAWFARMVTGGVDPHVIVRRMIVHASEDVGLAAPDALLQAVAAADALDRIGMPEARRVTRIPSGFNSRAMYMAVVSPSTVGLVAMMTSFTPPCWMRSSSWRMVRSSGPFWLSGEIRPCKTW